MPSRALASPRRRTPTRTRSRPSPPRSRRPSARTSSPARAAATRAPSHRWWSWPRRRARGSPRPTGASGSTCPSQHPLLETGPGLAEADVVVAIERAIPWVAGSPAGPPPIGDRRLARAGPDRGGHPGARLPRRLPHHVRSARRDHGAARSCSRRADRRRPRARRGPARRGARPPRRSDAELDDAAAAATGIPIDPPPSSPRSSAGCSTTRRSCSTSRCRARR